MPGGGSRQIATHSTAQLKEKILRMLKKRNGGGVPGKQEEEEEAEV